MPVVGNKTNILQPTSPGKIKVKTSSTEVLKENLHRNGSEYVNESANPIYLNFGKAAVAEEGIFIAKEGGSWNGMVGGMTWTGSVFAIAVGGESSMTVVEV